MPKSQLHAYLAVWLDLSTNSTEQHQLSKKLENIISIWRQLSREFIPHKITIKQAVTWYLNWTIDFFAIIPFGAKIGHTNHYLNTRCLSQYIESIPSQALRSGLASRGIEGTTTPPQQSMPKKPKNYLDRLAA